MHQLLQIPKTWLATMALACGMGMLTGQALALPSFARQTGFDCVACHMSWLELAPVGRQFKLGGYTLMKPVASGERPLLSFEQDGRPPILPLAGFVQASISHTANMRTAGIDDTTFPKQNQLVVQQLSLFYAGRIAEHFGAFSQWTYDGVAHHSSVDNVDVRFANRYSANGLDVMYGLSLNNSPTMSDIYNTTPVWAWPFTTSGVAPAPSASPLIAEGLAQQVVGLSAYSMWNRTLYAELGAYRTANGAFSAFRAGIPRDESAVLRGTAPYWRLALQHEWGDGTHSVMAGAYGLKARKYPDPLDTTTQADMFRDVGFDAQYQYITDIHRVSGQLNFIRETQTLDGTFTGGAASNPRNKLNTLASKLTYYYQNKYGISLGYQHTSGSADYLLYNTGEPVSGSVNGKPNSSSFIVELNWLPMRDRRFTLQYTAYQKFNGQKTNYDGFGRNARDNNTLYLVAWFPF